MHLRASGAPSCCPRARLSGDAQSFVSAKELKVFSGQTALTAAPSLYQEAIAAWRGKSVERHLLSATEIEEMTRMNSQRYGPIAPGSYPVRFHLHVPFAHGVFTLRSDRLETDQFSDLQIDFLQRLVNTISVGYARWRELLRLERDRTVQRMRAEVQAMQQGDRPPRLIHRSEEDAKQELFAHRRRWASDYPLERLPRSVIRVPFSHGSIAILHFDPDRFTQRDVDLVAAHADAISLGFTRFHDFQQLEQRHRELEIERAVEQVQIAVQNMRSSGLAEGRGNNRAN